jgi:hypothetical protein
MNYREPGRVIEDPRWAAETRLIEAKALIMKELARGIAIANNLARAEAEVASSYEKRLKAIQELHKYLAERVGL